MDWKSGLLGVAMIILLSMQACQEDDVVSNVLVETINVKGTYITDGGSTQMRAEVLPENATSQEVVWSVDDESIATISQSGLLTAVANGEVTVTATATDESGVSGSKLMVIGGWIVPVSSITIIGMDITDGLSQQLTVEVQPADANNQAVSWSVSDESIASISESGLLSPRTNGSVTVTATALDGSGVESSLVINISGMEDIDGIVVDNPASFLNAVTNAAPGDNIYIRGGTYAFSSTIPLNRIGTADNPISLLPYPNDPERPLFDFSAMSENSSNRGIQLAGSYWHIKGIDVFNAGDNGMFIRGHYNLIEFCTFFENSDSGLQIGNGGANNTILNCDSYYNADSRIEDADGFACKLDAGDGNKFIGCRAWQNLDDGWDGYLRGTDNITTYYENCWAIRNGYLKDGTKGGGDGNGFKTGGSDNKDLKHNAVYTRCIAAGNVVKGFDHNSNRGDVTLYNCASQDNGRNINFNTTNIANSLTIKNTVSIGGGGNSYNATTTDITNNSWQNALSATADDYVSLNIDLLLSDRKPDGSLPDVDYMKLVSGSDLVDQGVDVGLEYSGSAPDIGPFEKN